MSQKTHFSSSTACYGLALPLIIYNIYNLYGHLYHSQSLRTVIWHRGFGNKNDFAAEGQ
jgi:hypothetical protein